jgi:DNA-binding XRE family transcriptional regulator
MGQIERGTANPSAKTLFLIGQVLGLSVEDFFVLAARKEGNVEPQPRSKRRKRGM